MSNMYTLFLSLILALFTLPKSGTSSGAGDPGYPQPHWLRANAIVEDGKGASKFECWVFKTPFTVSTTPGTNGASQLDLAQLSNVSYVVLAPKSSGGRHNAPYNQIVALLSGKVVLSLPHSPETATVIGGANGFLIATDLQGSGHISNYPSDEQTRAFEMPFAGGKVPRHYVIRDGPCKAHEQIVYY